MSKSDLQKIELEERTLAGETAKRMADHTGVDLDWLLAGTTPSRRRLLPAVC